MNFIETQYRAIAKVVSWRVILTFVNFTYTYVVTGSWQAGLAVAGLAAIFNSFIYFFHERIWNLIKWGKIINSQEVK